MKMATITASAGTNKYTIQIDGEDTARSKPALKTAQFTPTIGKRAVVEEISGTYVILATMP